MKDISKRFEKRLYKLIIIGFILMIELGITKTSPIKSIDVFYSDLIDIIEPLDDEGPIVTYI